LVLNFGGKRQVGPHLEKHNSTKRRQIKKGTKKEGRKRDLSYERSQTKGKRLKPPNNKDFTRGCQVGNLGLNQK